MNNYKDTDYTREELITLAVKMAMRQARKWQDNAITEGDLDAAEHYENLANAYRAIIEETTAQQPQEAPQTAPAAEAEQQPTETENAPQAATQAAEGTTTDEEEEETPATPGDMLKVRNIIMSKGGYRERHLLTNPHTATRSTWTTEHKVIEILEATPDPDGYRADCAVDIVTRSIVG